MDSLSYEECKEFVPIMRQAKCVRVYDASTLCLGLVLPDPYGPTKFCCQLLGVDTPGLRSQHESEKALAREARDIVKDEVLQKVVDVRVAGKDKYGRLLVRVWTPTCPDLSAHLINEKVAMYHDGGKRRMCNWDVLLKEHAELKQSRLQRQLLP